MDSIVSLLLSFLLLYKYSSLFLIVFFSAIILPLPVNTLLLATGAFASQGYFGVIPSLLWGLLANVLGDIVGYSLTFYFGETFFKRSKLRRMSSFNLVEKFIYRHERMTIVVSRFLGTPGSLVNLFAGFIPVPFGRFLIYDIIGNILDLGSFFAAGFFLGGYSEVYSDVLSTVSWIIIISLVLFIVRLIWNGRREKIPK